MNFPISSLLCALRNQRARRLLQPSSVTGIEHPVTTAGVLHAANRRWKPGRNLHHLGAQTTTAIR
jgi:hypothetical protein